jgi:hypothetical protein
MTEQQILSNIVADYAPYDRYEAFAEGYAAYHLGQLANPCDGVQAQAWDRGANAAMRFARAIAGQGERPRYIAA